MHVLLLTEADRILTNNPHYHNVVMGVIIGAILIFSIFFGILMPLIARKQKK